MERWRGRNGRAFRSGDVGGGGMVMKKGRRRGWGGGGVGGGGLLKVAKVNCRN